jgi:hypothetical protein
MPAEFLDRHDAGFSNDIATGARRIAWEGIQLPGRHQDGREIFLEMSFGEFVTNGRRLFTGVMRDITDRRRAEIELKRTQEQLHQAQKMEAIGRLAAGVAHDFNNRLTTILGYSSLLLQRRAPNEAPDHRLLVIRQSAERAAELIRQLMAFSRRQVIEPGVSDLNVVVAHVETTLRDMVGRNIALDVSLAPRPAPVRLDAGQLEQMLINLVVNARDAMPQGGRLGIEVAEAEIDESLAQGELSPGPGSFITLTVRDSGTGMDPETMARIFEPFFTSKPFGQGTGLGLAIVYGIVQQSGGHVAVHSEPGEGASFVITLPRAKELPSEGAADSNAVPTAGVETVLLVDDEEPVRQLASEILGGQGYTVLESADAQDALRVAGLHPGRIDLLVTDVVMPGMSGGELAEQLLRSHPGLRVLFVSGYSDDAVVLEGVSREGFAFLEKPFTYEAFAVKVREVLDAPRGSQAA